MSSRKKVKKSSGGLNLGQRMRQAGVDFKKGEVIRLALSQLKLITSGPRKHPRSHLPPDPELVALIKARGIPTDERRFTVQQDGELFEVVDGARRTIAARVVERWLQRHQPRQAPLEWDRADPEDPGRLYVETEIVSLSAVDLSLRRLNANKTRGLRDTASVLAAIVASIIKANKGEPDDELMARIVDAMPQGVTAGVVIALSRWDELSPELQARFESGDAPLGLLPVVLAASVDDREEMLNMAIRDGVRSQKGATRRANKARTAADPWARRMTPRQAERVGARLVEACPDALPMTVTAKGLAMGMALATAESKEAERLLNMLPARMAQAIREARAAKGGAK